MCIRDSFKILSESGISAGVRRIEAVTGHGLLHLLDSREQTIAQAAAILKAKPSELVGRARSVMNEQRAAHQTIEELRSQVAGAALELSLIHICVMSEQTAKALRDMMEQTCLRGTGTTARPEGFDVAGKTASAETGWLRGGESVVHGSFAGCFPADDPRYVLVVLVENGKSGSVAAAPIFREVAQRVMQPETLEDAQEAQDAQGAQEAQGAQGTQGAAQGAQGVQDAQEAQGVQGAQQGAAQGAQEQIAGYEQQITDLQGQIETLNGQIATLTEQASAAQGAQEQIAGYEQQLSSLQGEVEALRAQATTLEAVSYTHLDVYKRQAPIACRFARKFPPARPCARCSRPAHGTP